MLKPDIEVIENRQTMILVLEGRLHERVHVQEMMC